MAGSFASFTRLGSSRYLNFNDAQLSWTQERRLTLQWTLCENWSAVLLWTRGSRWIGLKARFQRTSILVGAGNVKQTGRQICTPTMRVTGNEILSPKLLRQNSESSCWGRHHGPSFANCRVCSNYTGWYGYIHKGIDKSSNKTSFCDSSDRAALPAPVETCWTTVGKPHLKRTPGIEPFPCECFVGHHGNGPINQKVVETNPGCWIFPPTTRIQCRIKQFSRPRTAQPWKGNCRMFRSRWRSSSRKYGSGKASVETLGPQLLKWSLWVAPVLLAVPPNEQMVN